MTTFLCILQNQVSRPPRKKEWGWLTCFPFFLLLIPSTMNHWHFPQFAFHRSLSSAPPLGNMNFINREVWALLLGSPQACAGVHMSLRASRSGLGLPFLLCLWVFVAFPLPSALASPPPPFPYRSVFELTPFP